MNLMKVTDLKKRIVNLIEIERQVANRTLKNAIKAKDNDVLIVSQSYLMALQRMQEILNNLFKELKDGC